MWIWSPGLDKPGASVNFQLTPCRSKALPVAPQSDFTDHKDKENKQSIKIVCWTLGPDQSEQVHPAPARAGPVQVLRASQARISPAPCRGSQDPTVSREVGRGPEGRAGTHLPAAPRGCRINKREAAKRGGGPGQAQDCSMSEGLLGPPRHLNSPSCESPQGAVSACGAGQPLGASSGNCVQAEGAFVL